MRRALIAGNWKMNLDRRGAIELAQAVRRHAEHNSAVDVALFPPFVYLDEVAKVLAGSSVALGAQNMCDEAAGAFTGETSGAMLRDVGCRMVLLGHSERRHVYGEGDALVARKVRAALAIGLEPVLCVGETLAERDGNRTEEVVRRQTEVALHGLEPRELGRVTLAYEPVWAIGTGRNATAAQAGEVHMFLRGVLGAMFGPAVAQGTRILYGGSVKPDNIRELRAAPGVDGALVGGASLKAASFNALIDG